MLDFKISSMLSVERGLITKSNKRILMLIADGLGGLPRKEDGKTELEVANTPNLDELARRGIMGLIEPIEAGISPGSGPAHLSLFGYDPRRYDVGRGVLEALGLGLDVSRGDVAIRGNFATIKDGVIVDRRAGRISTQKCKELVGKLSENIKEYKGFRIMWKPGLEHRFAIVIKGDNLGANVNDTDPQKEGLKPLEAKAKDECSLITAEIMNYIVEKASALLKDEPQANFILLRGVASKPDIPTFGERYYMKALGLANYPMYKGVARLVGMDVPDVGESFEGIVEYYKEHAEAYDFVFVHYKWTDKAGEDGDFMRKVKEIERFDSFIPHFLSNSPDVIFISGDHSTPSTWKGHSWHPVPAVIVAENAGCDDRKAFTERQAKCGYLGLRKSYEIMQILLALSGRLKKFGA